MSMGWLRCLHRRVSQWSGKQSLVCGRLFYILVCIVCINPYAYLSIKVPMRADWKGLSP
ncbi:hypothetical protein EMIT0P176_260016 [Pseudomonas sp. IT-P176]